LIELATGEFAAEASRIEAEASGVQPGPRGSRAPLAMLHRL